MGDEQHGFRPFRPDPQQLETHLVPCQRVERGERLVHQQDIRIEQQGTRDRDPLLHAARQFVRTARGEIRQAHEFEQPAGTFTLHVGHPTVFVTHGKCDVAEHVEPRQQRRLLENDADFVPRLRHRHPENLNTAGRRANQPGDQPQQSRFAAAGRPEHGDELMPANIEGQTIERDDRVAIGTGKALADIGEADHGLRDDHRQASARLCEPRINGLR